MSSSATKKRLVTSQPVSLKKKEMGVHYGGFDRIGADDWTQAHEPEALMRLYIRNQIEFAMKARGMTQTELAKRLGVTPTNINTMLRRRENLTLDTVAKIFRQLGYFPLISLTQWDPPSEKALRKRKKHSQASDAMKDKSKARMMTFFERMWRQQPVQSQAPKAPDTESVNYGSPPHRQRSEPAPAGASHV
jgi:transcriptional regulator with XRE-family HTH domain